MRVEIHNKNNELIGSVDWDGTLFHYEGEGRRVQDGTFRVFDFEKGKRMVESDGEDYMRALLWVWKNAYAYASIVDSEVKKESDDERHR